MKHQIIAFDFDGTLVDSRKAIVAAIQAAFVEYGIIPPTAEAVHQVMGIPAEKSFLILHNNIISEEETLKIVDRYREIYLAQGKELLEMYPGIPELMQDLHQAGAKMGVVTSKMADAVWADAKFLGLDKYLAEVIGPHHVKNPKPHPDPLRALCKFFGKYPDPTTIMVGDATFDIDCGNSAGAHTCAVTWGAHGEKQLLESKPTFIAKTVAELREIL